MELKHYFSDGKLMTHMSKVTCHKVLGDHNRLKLIFKSVPDSLQGFWRLWWCPHKNGVCFHMAFRPTINYTRESSRASKKSCKNRDSFPVVFRGCRGWGRALSKQALCILEHPQEALGKGMRWPLGWRRWCQASTSGQPPSARIHGSPNASVGREGRFRIVSFLFGAARDMPAESRWAFSKFLTGPAQNACHPWTICYHRSVLS